MGKMVIVASGKGGTGKTTFTSQVGANLADKGYLTVVVDADAGFRNLDIAMGLESQVVYDYSDFINGDSDIDEVIIRANQEDLYFIAAPQSAQTSDFDGEKTAKFWETLKARFDFVLADAPAGMGDGFAFAADYADEGIIVSLAEASSLRDADRVTEELFSKGIDEVRLVLNRVKPDLIEKKVLMNVDDCIDVLSIPILGIVPEDGAVAECVTGGKRLVRESDTSAAQAFSNIATRLSGEYVPMMEFEPEKKSVWSRMRNALKKA